MSDEPVATPQPAEERTQASGAPAAAPEPSSSAERDAAADAAPPPPEMSQAPPPPEMSQAPPPLVAAVTAAAPPQAEPDTELVSVGDQDPESRSSSRQGYGTFQDPGPIETSTSTAQSPTEDATLVAGSPPHVPDLSNAMVFANLMKASMGTGILAMPLAMRNAGYAVGTPVFLALAAVCVYCIHLLVQSSRTLRRRLGVPKLEYADTAGAACQSSSLPKLQKVAPYAKVFTKFFLAVYMIGTCSVYVLFVKENLKQMLDTACPENTWSSLNYLLHLALVLAVLVAIPNMNSLSLVSTIANVAMVVGVVLCLVLAGMQITATHQASQLLYDRKLDAWTNSSIHNVTVEAWAGWDCLPLFFGTAVFALEGIGVVLKLENMMIHPADFLSLYGVLHKAMAFITVLYSLMGLLGYLAYGETTKGSVTLNLQPDSILALWVRKAVTLSVLLTFPLQFHVPEELLWGWLNAGIQLAPQLCTCPSGLSRLVFKVVLMLATVFLPLLVPRLGPAISLVGAVCLSMLGIILPTVIHAVTYWDDVYPNIRQWRVWSRVALHAFIVVIGVVGLVTGTYSSVEELQKGPAPQ